VRLHFAVTPNLGEGGCSTNITEDVGVHAAANAIDPRQGSVSATR